MNRLASVSELNMLGKKIAAEREMVETTITICQGTGCKAYNSQKVYKSLEEEISSRGLTGKVVPRSTGCHGFCQQGPMVVIFPEEICYCRVKPEDISEIIEKTVLEKKVIHRLLFKDPVSGERIIKESDIPFYKHQNRLIFGNNRLVDPQNIQDYIAIGGYKTLGKILEKNTPKEVLEEVKKANLRGRGGAGFPAGIKWENTSNAPGEGKYVIVNADEGDPGAYMDRSLLEGNPHLILEGLITGAYAMGAEEGVIFLRQEYPLALENISEAVEQAREYGLLGEDILGTGFNFEVRIKRSAGAFVTGESSALVAAIEGSPGQPRPKHVNTAISGVGGRPSNINNVETWANVPIIMEKGAPWYNSLGSENNPGTKVFSLVGKVNNTGLIEVPLGTPLKKIIYDIGGGIKDGKKFKAVQTGGPSGGCIPEQHLDMPVDFDQLHQIGSMMGSGGMIVMDETSCMVDVARYFMKFLKEESCGKCTSCREGVHMMFSILEGITHGKGCKDDLEFLEDLAWTTRNTSLCALGKTASNPVLSTLKYFREEYQAHIQNKRCPAGVCRELITYAIDQDKCNGCGRCQKLCSHDAIEGEKKSPMNINTDACTRCGVCLEVCRFSAVIVQ